VGQGGGKEERHEILWTPGKYLLGVGQLTGGIWRDRGKASGKSRLHCASKEQGRGPSDLFFFHRQDQNEPRQGHRKEKDDPGERNCHRKAMVKPRPRGGAQIVEKNSAANHAVSNGKDKKEETRPLKPKFFLRGKKKRLVREEKTTSQQHGEARLPLRTGTSMETGGSVRGEQPTR